MRRRRTAVVADDDERSRALVRALLGEDGYEFLEAADGAHALELASRPGVDLVVADVLMPGVDGYRLSLELRRAGCTVPIVLVTGAFSEPHVERLGLDMGADAVLFKPLETTRFEATVAAVLAGPRERPAAGQPPIVRYVERPADQAVGGGDEAARDRDRLRAQNDQLAALGRELLVEKRRLRILLDTTSDGVLGIGADGNVRLANPAAAKALGWAVDDLPGRPFHATIHPGEPMEGCELGAAFGRRASLPEARSVFSTAAGREFPVSLSLTIPASPGGDAILVFRDIARREAAEQARREGDRATLLRAAFQVLPIGAGIGTPDGRIVAVNEAFARMIGRPAETFEGEPWGPFATARNGAVAWAAAVQMETKGSATTELALRSESGEPIPVEIRWSALRGADGAITHYFVSIRDLREERAAQEQRERAFAAAASAERLAGLGTLVAGVAHEINNPLMYIQGSVELLEVHVAALREAGAPAEPLDAIEKDAATALQGLERIATITKGLRRVARRGPRVTVDVDLRELAEQVVAVATPRLGPQVALRIDATDHATTRGDPTEILQVLLNLLLNAGDAIGGAPGSVTIVVREEGPLVLVDVTDTGSGIPAEKQASIFTPFYTSKPEGTGLGLSISRAIARAHGGDLAFVSTPGTGTTFTLKLPNARATLEAPP